MSTINQKMGLKPKTRKRAATHSSSLVSNARCPECNGRHVVRNEILGVMKHMCGSCSHVWVEGAKA